MKYQNPIIPGFYPDPSICRVGEDYYLVNSSFEFFPGVPLFHSRDLVNWEQLGYVLTRDSQDPLAACRTSGGIFAPTLRYRDGRFYMVTTSVTHGGNFFVWTDDIRGEWSEPVYVKQGGIDPSLFWDDDGTVYFQSTFNDEEGIQCIGQCALDLSTGEMLTETRPIWYGTGGKCPEGPHMYKKDGFYYLMIAEGGTEYGHMETIARSRSPWGPFEGCPRNPILTHRDVNPRFGEFQGLGHADLTEDGAGNWWIVFHAIRPSQFMLHHIGRETMAAPVTWDENGWPLVNGGRPITAEMEAPGKAEAVRPDGAAVQNGFAQEDDFTQESALSCQWAYLRNPVREHYVLDGGLTLVSGTETLESAGSPTFLGRRQQHFGAVSETLLDFSPASEAAEAGLTVFHTKDHHYDLVVSRREGRTAAFLRRRVCDILTESDPVALPEGEALRLVVRAERTGYEFLAGPEHGELVSLGTGCTQLLSTECMICTFTGCFIGLFCQGEPGAKARFLRFSYRPGQE